MWAANPLPRLGLAFDETGNIAEATITGPIALGVIHASDDDADLLCAGDRNIHPVRVAHETGRSMSPREA